MSDRFIILATFEKSFEAELARAALADAGIESVLDDEHVVSSVWTLAAGLGGVKLKVRESDAEKALTAYREIESDMKSGMGIDDEELSRQAMEGEREDDDSGEHESPADVPEVQVDPLSESIIEDREFDPDSRERAARRLFFVAWFGLIIPGFAFYALYVFFQAAFGTGRLTSQGRLNLFVGSIVVFFSLFYTYFVMSMVMGRQ